MAGEYPQLSQPSPGFNLAGARNAGYSDSEIADYLSQQSSFDIGAARKAGYSDNEITGFLSAPPPPAPAKEDQSSTIGATVRGAERGAAPAAGGFAGMVGGAKLGAMAGAAIPVLGETGIGELGGAVVGGLAGAFGGSAAVQSVQNAILDMVPESVRAAIGQSKTQQEADELAHPYASMIGELAPNLALMRPGAAVKLAESGGSALARALASPVGSRAVGAGLMGAQEAATEEIQTGTIDPTKVAIAAGSGALMNRETKLGEGIRSRIEGAIPRIGPVPTSAPPEAVAEAVTAAPSVDAAIATAKSVAEAPASVGAATADVRAAGEAASQANAPEAEPTQIEKEQSALSTMRDKASQERFLDTGEPPPVEAAPSTSRPSPAPLEPAYSEAKTRATTYQRWLSELDDKRREDADKSPQASFLRQTADVILKKVNGVEDRLTGAQAERLATARQALDQLLNPEGDSASMAKVRDAMVAEQQRMADAAAPARKEPIEASVSQEQDVLRDDTSQTPPQGPAEAVPQEQAAQGGGVQPLSEPATTGAADVRELPRDISAAVAKETNPIESPVDAIAPAPDQPIKAPRPTGGEISQEPIAPSVKAEVAATEPTPTLAVEPVKFTTAKGSTYEVHSDGTTTRDKAARPEHPGESGPQPRSEATIYVNADDTDKLSLFQTQGGPAMAVSPVGDGRWGVKYLEGKDAGKFEARTVVTPMAEPAVGLTPVEVFKDGTRVHFGNEITDVVQPPQMVDTPIPTRARAIKPVEGTGETKVRGLARSTEDEAVARGLVDTFGDLPEYRVATNADQKQMANALIAKDYDAAKDIALGIKQPPKGLLSASVFIAVRRKALDDGDSNLIRRLGTQSRLLQETTAAAQHLQALGVRDPADPVEAIKALQDARAAKAKERGIDPVKEQAALTEEYAAAAMAEKQSVATSTKRPAWNDFISSIMCPT